MMMMQGYWFNKAGTARGVLRLGDRPEPTFPYYQFICRNITIRAFSIMGMTETAKEQAIQVISAYPEGGRIDHKISARFGWNEMIDAHEAVERGDQKACVLAGVH